MTLIVKSYPHLQGKGRGYVSMDLVANCRQCVVVIGCRNCLLVCVHFVLCFTGARWLTLCAVRFGP